MTVFHGELLFDLAEKPINGWENQLGYRGYVEAWKRGDYTLIIEPYEDGDQEDSWEVWVRNERTGDWEPIAFGDSFEEADKLAKEWMRTHTTLEEG